ncbi:hypothetical protein D3C74_326400 [compost metagenome]
MAKRGANTRTNWAVQGVWNYAATGEEKNRALKKLVERVVYDREGGNRIELMVCYN